MADVDEFAVVGEEGVSEGCCYAVEDLCFKSVLGEGHWVWVRGESVSETIDCESPVA